jgi:hypothetical protein
VTKKTVAEADSKNLGASFLPYSPSVSHRLGPRSEEPKARSDAADQQLFCDGFDDGNRLPLFPKAVCEATFAIRCFLTGHVVFRHTASISEAVDHAKRGVLKRIEENVFSNSPSIFSTDLFQSNSSG